MDRQQLIIATAAALFAAFLMGWLAGWLLHRLTRPGGGADAGAVEGLAQQLHEAEAARDAAVTALEAREADLRAALDALDECRTEVEELRDYIEKKLARSRGTPG